MIRDLGSTNGTWVNDQRVIPGRDVALAVGDRIVFADVGWVFCNADAPLPFAILLGGNRGRTFKDGMITIPDDSGALASIFMAPDGGWTLEVADEVRSIRSGEVFRVSDQAWTFWSPTVWQATARKPRPRLVSESTLVFEVSQDEERVILTVESQQERVALGQLSGYYLLLTLARVREASPPESGPEGGGWVHRDDLIRMLRCGEQQLNVWIHRIRSRFSLKGFLDYASIIERRDGTGQMRLGGARTIIRST